MTSSDRAESFRRGYLSFDTFYSLTGVKSKSSVANTNAPSFDVKSISRHDDMYVDKPSNFNTPAFLPQSVSNTDLKFLGSQERVGVDNASLAGLSAVVKEVALPQPLLLSLHTNSMPVKKYMAMDPVSSSFPKSYLKCSGEASTEEVINASASTSHDPKGTFKRRCTYFGPVAGTLADHTQSSNTIVNQVGTLATTGTAMVYPRRMSCPGQVPMPSIQNAHEQHERDHFPLSSIGGSEHDGEVLDEFSRFIDAMIQLP